MVFWSLKEFIIGFKSIFMVLKINILNPFIYFLRDQKILGRDTTVCKGRIPPKSFTLERCLFLEKPE